MTYLNEQKVVSLTKASVMAEEFSLTRKSVFSCPVGREPQLDAREAWNGHPKTSMSAGPVQGSPPRSNRTCFYCHKAGHFVADCVMLKAKTDCKNAKQSHFAGVGLSNSMSSSLSPLNDGQEVQPAFKPFTFMGTASIPGSQVRSIKILRDTGAAQSLLLSEVLPVSEDTFCQSYVYVQGIKMGVNRIPLLNVNLRTDLVSGAVRVGVCDHLPVKDISMILGNYLAGGKVSLLLEVTCAPLIHVVKELGLSTLLPECAAT